MLTLPMWLAADTTPPNPPQPAPVMVVFGDSYAGSGYGGDTYNGWPATVGRALGAEVVNDAVSGSGYRLHGNHSTFPYAATTHPVRSADVVVIWGSLNDWEQDAEAVRQSAVVTYAAVRSWTDAPILAIGPQWPNANRPPGLLAVRDALSSAAAASQGVTWVDASAWFDGRPELIGPDGWHPTLAGQAYLADKIRPLVAAALAQG